MTHPVPIQRTVMRPTAGATARAAARRAEHRMRMLAIPAALLMLAAIVLAGAAHAQASQAPAQAAPTAVGDTTRGLLALQRDGRRASATPRPIDGPVAETSYQRYLDSFRHPIPESASERERLSRGAGAGASDAPRTR
jgi:hypothetical protein